MKRTQLIAAYAAMVVSGFVLAFGLLEVVLTLYDFRPAPPAHAAAPPPPPISSAATLDIPADMLAKQKYRHSLLTMPPEWERRPVPIDGAYHAEYWHSELHVYNKYGQRRIGPHSPKRDGLFRVLVMGDSITYGAGIAEQHTYTALLNQWLGHNGRIEFLNLGISGQQSEDTLRWIKKFVPELGPDLVFYGVCLNDFLPSGRGEYDDRHVYAVPLPEKFKAFLIRNSRTAALTNDLYDDTLRLLHVRATFLDHILSDFDGYQVRFARDVAEMNKFLIGSGLPPMVAMVLDQYPAYDGTHHRISRIAEAALEKAGARVIPTEDYYRANSGKAHYVSRWDGHPDEVANLIWANMIRNWLTQNNIISR
jgi:GDSL-like Lipase/Acylhydrolase family